MIRIAICDDEAAETAHLQLLLEQYKTEKKAALVCHTYKSGLDLIAAAKSEEYQLIFLDVLMPGFSGLDTAREIRSSDKEVKIIFLSSSPEFAIESYSVQAYYYLIKPLTQKQLYFLLDKVTEMIPIQQSSGILVKNKDVTTRILFSRIEYVEIINKTVGFHLSDGSVHEVFGTLLDFEGKLLSRPEFFKVHRSYIINLEHVKSVSAKLVTTDTGHLIPVSRMLYPQFKEHYLSYLFQNQDNSPAPEKFSPSPLRDTNAFAESAAWENVSPRILMVDDEPEMLAPLIKLLQDKGCTVTITDSPDETLSLLAVHIYDCILLDLILFDEKSFSLCRQIRAGTKAPILFLSNVTDYQNQLLGFQSGCLDYLTKDIPPELLWLKIESRLKPRCNDTTELRMPPLRLNRTLRKLFLDETELIVSPVEFDILCIMAEHAGQVYSPTELYQSIHGSESWDSRQTIQAHMSRLRIKLEKICPYHRFIETVWGQGYCFVPYKAKS